MPQSPRQHKHLFLPGAAEDPSPESSGTVPAFLPCKPGFSNLVHSYRGKFWLAPITFVIYLAELSATVKFVLRINSGRSLMARRFSVVSET